MGDKKAVVSGILLSSISIILLYDLLTTFFQIDAGKGYYLYNSIFHLTYLLVSLIVSVFLFLNKKGASITSLVIFLGYIIS